MKIIKDILKDKIIDAIFDIVTIDRNKNVWKTNLISWHDNITNNSIGSVSILNLRLIEHEFYLILYTELQKYCPDGYSIKDILYYEWNALSQISWHNDGDKMNRIGLTIYLNSHWDRNWGGFFCWEESTDIYKMYIPNYNTGVFIESDINHHVSIISPYAPPRKTLQVWMFPNKDI